MAAGTEPMLPGAHGVGVSHVTLGAENPVMGLRTPDLCALVSTRPPEVVPRYC